MVNFPEGRILIRRELITPLVAPHFFSQILNVFSSLAIFLSTKIIFFSRFDLIRFKAKILFTPASEGICCIYSSFLFLFRYYPIG